MHDPEFDDYPPPAAFAKGEETRKDGTTPPVWGNPWRTIWFAPRGTIRAIVESGRNRAVLVLAMANGINALLGPAFRDTPGDAIAPKAVLGVVVLGSILGIVVNFLGAALVRWIGNWHGGRATVAECWLALAWGSLPTAVNVAIMLGLILLAGTNPFLPADPGAADEPIATAVVLTMPIRLLMSIWAVVLPIRTVAEVHRFSSWKSVLVLIVASLIFIFAMVGCLVVFRMFAR